MDRKKYKKIIQSKRDENDYIPTKDILDIIERAIKEYKEDLIENPKGLLGLFPDIIYCKTNAIAGQDSRGIK